MKNKRVFLLMLIASSLMANIDMPQVLEYEKILKDMQDRKKQLPDLIPPVAQSFVAREIDSGFPEVVLLGTTQINNKKYCYISLSGTRKIIKATIGMKIKDKVIKEIGDYGITYLDKDKSVFLPIVTTPIEGDGSLPNFNQNN